jgi:hypothetical protein
MTGIGFGCSEEGFDIAEPNIAEEEKTATIVLNNIPQDYRGDSVFVFTLNNLGELNSFTSSSATEDSEVSISAPEGNASFTIIAYIPTVSDWNAENALDFEGFYSTLTGASNRNGRYITTSWQSAVSYEDSNKDGASDILSIDLAIDGEQAPVDNSYARGDILTLSADVTNNLISGVSAVSFEINGTQIEEVNQEPYSINFNTVEYQPGAYVISTTVTNEEGDTSSDEIEIVITSSANEAPSVNITGITNGATYDRQTVLTINSNATDDNAVDRVEFIINGTTVSTVTEAPFTYEWDTFDNQVGEVTVEVVAYDEDAAQRSDFVNVTLIEPENYFPRVNLTAPSNNANIQQGDLITLRATTSDIEGDNINSVTFRIIDEAGFQQFSSTVSVAPYEVVDYNTQGLVPGTYEIEAQVNGSGGFSTDTIIINITQ